MEWRNNKKRKEVKLEFNDNKKIITMDFWGIIYDLETDPYSLYFEEKMSENF